MEIEKQSWKLVREPVRKKLFNKLIFVIAKVKVFESCVYRGWTAEKILFEFYSVWEIVYWEIIEQYFQVYFRHLIV